MNTFKIDNYILRASKILTVDSMPWDITAHIQSTMAKWISSLDSNYVIENNIAIHKTAVVEQHVILKGPIIIGPGCFIGAHAYLRGGIFLDENVSIGPGCEVKSSILFSGASLAHFNFVGDSIIGSNVNMEAGSIIANHYNEREEKTISVVIGGMKVLTGVTKFGALIGDSTKIGANAVLSPGTILPPKNVVKRLELISQSE